MEKKSWKHGELFLRLMLVFLFIGLQIYYYNISPTFKETEITDTDSFTRLTRVEDLYNTGDWYDSFNERSNAPYGESQHWTRPLDVLLLIGGWALSPIFGFKQGLLLWGIIFNPFLGAFTLFILHRLISPYFDIQGQRLVGLLFFSQMAMWETYRIGHPDHHGLIITLFIITLCYLFRSVDENQLENTSVWAGLAAAAGFWVSVEFITVIFMIFVVMGINWLRRGGFYIRRLMIFSRSLLISATVFLLIERPLPDFFMVEYDKISFVHIFVFTICTVAMWILIRLPLEKAPSRVMSTFMVGLLASTAVWLVTPDFFSGPFADVNKEIYPVWLLKVNEIQPLSEQPLMLFMLIGLLILGVISIYLVIRNDKYLTKNILFPLVIGLFIFSPLSLYQLRWYRYADVILFLLISFGLSLAMQKTLLIKSSLQQGSIRIMLILIACFFPFMAALFPISPGENNTNHEEILKPFCTWVNKNEDRIPAGSSILTFVNFGPEILYRTQLRVIATPYHRNDTGILFLHKVMTTTNDLSVIKLLNERDVQFIFIKTNSLSFDHSNSDSQTATFYERLNNAHIPDWLSSIDLPKQVSSEYRLFSVSIP